MGLTSGLLDAGPLGRALGAVVNGKAPELILDTWATQRRNKWLDFTNAFSIENKRMVQRGGYSNDPNGIWRLDHVSRAHGMDEWIKSATPAKKQEDQEMYQAMQDRELQLASRMKQWDITMDPLWMAAYEDPEVVKARIALRPQASSTTTASE